jgi:hypothetical protein
MDRHGRVFFIDHKNRTTTWKKPEPIINPISNNPTDVSQRNPDDQTGNNNEMLYQVFRME